MTMTMIEAEKILLKTLPKGTNVVSSIEYDGMFLFIAYRPDSLEGYLDPFFSVNPKSGYCRDFSPSDYDEPLVVINALNAAKRAK